MYELMFLRCLYEYQKKRLLLLIPAAIGVGLAEIVWPTFFNYPYWKWTISWGDIWVFWPLFLYGLVTAVLGSIGVLALNEKREQKLLFLDVVTSVLAGIWEEVGYRCLFVFYAMLGLYWLNLGISLIVAMGVFWGTLYLALAMVDSATKGARRRGSLNVITVVAAIILICLGLFFAVEAFSVNWRYMPGKAVLMLADLVTFYQLSNVFSGGDQLFALGLVMTNAWFRDGHKYQGWYGIINSWMGGLIFAGAMVNHGLLTAITVHVVYDCIFGITRYALAKRAR